MRKTSLHFHQTFAPEREYISKLLALADGNLLLSKEDIFEKTGIPTGKSSGKVEPHICYAVFMGLLTDQVKNGDHLLARTELGKAVFENDPHLMEPLTMLLCHYNLSRPISGAALWHYVFHKAIPGLGRHIEGAVLDNVCRNEFGPTKIRFSPLRTCYSADKCLGQLGLLDVENDIWRFKPAPYQSDYLYAYAYTLLSSWEWLLPNRREVTFDEVQDVIGWNKSYLWSDRETLNALDSLGDLRVISLNKQLKPITVIRNATQYSVLEKLYSVRL